MVLLSLAGPLTKGLNAHALNNNTSGSICILKHPKFKKSEDFQNLIPMKRVHVSAHRLTEKMPRCAGDCDSNAHCAKGLYCFQRNDKSAIPGCLSTTQDINTWDYCDSKSTTVDKNPLPMISEGVNGHFRAMRRCEGDCDRDTDCGNTGMKCFQRNGYTELPGCTDFDACKNNTCPQLQGDPFKRRAECTDLPAPSMGPSRPLAFFRTRITAWLY